MSPSSNENPSDQPEERGFFNTVWYGQSAWTALLLPLSWLFGAAVRLRRIAFERGALARVQLPVPVVIVGNITVGGTGKTPVAAWLARELRARGRRPGIVSRGYGGRRGRVPQFVEADGDAVVVGDEPLQLRRSAGVPVCVAADRVAAARALVDSGVDVVISDDGLQHYRLARDFEIAVLDGSRMLGNEHMLPAGPLREPVSRLGEVDLVMLNGDARLEGAVNFRLVPNSVQALRGARRVDLHRFCGQRVWSVAGIGNPGRFDRMLEDAGIEAVPVYVPDHGKVELGKLVQREAMPILMTEKDAVKYGDSSVDDVWVVGVELYMHSHSRAQVLTRIEEVLH